MLKFACIQILVTLLFLIGCTEQEDTSVHAEVYLGSDELAEKLNSAREAAIGVLELTNFGDTLCPAETAPTELRSHLLKGSDQAREDLRSDIRNDERFRQKMTIALRRINITFKPPTPGFRSDEEARIDEVIKSEGEVPVRFNESKIKDYSLASLIRIVTHEAEHIFDGGVHVDSSSYLGFAEFQEHANFLGACLGAIDANPPSIKPAFVGQYRAQIFGHYYPLVLTSNGSNVEGFLGAIPGSSGRSNLLEPRYRDGLLEFEANVKGNRFRFEAQLTGDLLQGTYGLKDDASSNVWTATKFKTYFSDYTFMNFSDRWQLRDGTLPLVANNAIFGNSDITPTNGMVFAPRVPLPSKVSVSANIGIRDGVNTSAGIAVGSPNFQRCLAVFVARDTSGETHAIYHVCGESAPKNYVYLGSFTGDLHFEIAVEMCGDFLGVFVDGVLTLQVPSTDLNPNEINPTYRSGLVVNTSEAFASNFVVREALFCKSK